MALAVAGARFEDAVYRDRLARAAQEAAARDLDALLITPSADYAYLLESGNLKLEGRGSDLAKDDDIVRAYMGG